MTVYNKCVLLFSILSRVVGGVVVVGENDSDFVGVVIVYVGDRDILMGVINMLCL